MIIGITGSIATGKSTVSKYIVSKGYELVDSDVLSYQALTIDQYCISQVINRFECADVNGQIDRKKLAKIVFHDPQAKKDLEGIVHPYVIEHIRQAISQSSKKNIFLDIPLLYESHLEYLCDKIVVVYVDENKQLSRLLDRNHYSLEEADSRISSQISIEKKKELGDYIINNEGSLEQLYQQVDLFLELLEKGEVPWKQS